MSDEKLPTGSWNKVAGDGMPMSNAMLAGLGTEVLMQMHAQIGRELDRRYHEAIRERDDAAAELVKVRESMEDE